MRIGGPVDLWLVAESEPAAGAALGLCRQADVRVRFPVGDHWLARDDGLEGACLTLGQVARSLEWVSEGVVVGGRYPLAALALAAARRGFSGLESLGGLPGTVADGIHAGFFGSRPLALRVLRGTRPATLTLDKWKPSHAVVWVRLSLDLELPTTVLARTDRKSVV
jgi:hypothetical protein